MIIEKMVELLILKDIVNSYYDDRTYQVFIDNVYNFSKIKNRYLELGQEFLNDYALDNTEKSDNTYGS